MTLTAWDLRNTLIAILNEAQRSGQPYVDIEPGDLDEGLRADRTSSACGVMHHDIMTKMMRPGDTVLKDSKNGETPMVIRYVFDSSHSIA